MPVGIDHQNGITELTLNWPETGNALGPTEARQLRMAFAGIASDACTRVAVLSARGAVFCSGGNLHAITELVKGGADIVRTAIYGEFQELFRNVRDCPVPLFAAVDGPAIGLGADLALAADTVFIGNAGWLKQGWISLGLIPATGGIMDFGRHTAANMFWPFVAASRVTAAEAQSMGLASAVPEGRAAALELAETLAGLPGPQIRALKKLMKIRDPDTHLAAALDDQVRFLTDPAFIERASALLRRSVKKAPD